MEQKNKFETQQTASLRAGKKTYFIDLQKNENGTERLVLTESTWDKETNKYKRKQLFVQQDYMLPFGHLIGQVLEKQKDKIRKAKAITEQGERDDADAAHAQNLAKRKAAIEQARNQAKDNEIER